MRSRTRIVVQRIVTGGADLTAPTPPAAQSLAATATTASVTYTHPGAPGGTTYALTVTDEADASVTPSSGSGLGPYVFPVASDKAYKARLRATGTDGQVADGVALVMVQPADPLAWATPAAVLVTAGTTSGVVTWATPTGGATPYTYGTAGIVSDSAGASTTATLSTAGTAPGATTLAGLVNGQTVVIQRTVTDADGAQITIQAPVTVAATAAGVTPGTAPAGQSLAAGTTSVTIGTWGAPSGGTGPYTYAVTDPTGATTIGGSGLGPWTAAGLTDGVTYAFLLTITDALLAKGYSVVTVSVAAAASTGDWVVVDSLRFDDGDWTAVTSTSTAQSTSAFQLTLYASDGTTPRAYVYNNLAIARTVTLDADGLTLVNGTSAVAPAMGVWPAGWDALRSGSRADAWLIEALVEGEEPAGSGSFVHLQGASTVTASPAATPTTGIRLVNSTTKVNMLAACYIAAFDNVSVRTIDPSPDRTYAASVQVTIADSRRHDIYITAGATDFCDPLTGLRVRAQGASSSMSAVGAENPTSAAWFGTSVSARTKWWLYHDGTATSGSFVRLVGLRLLRKPRGSL